LLRAALVWLDRHIGNLQRLSSMQRGAKDRLNCIREVGIEIDNGSFCGLKRRSPNPPPTSTRYGPLKRWLLQYVVTTFHYCSETFPANIQNWNITLSRRKQERVLSTEHL
jgi:hypothetical protein